jgi:hypothetical protein
VTGAVCRIEDEGGPVAPGVSQLTPDRRQAPYRLRHTLGAGSNLTVWLMTCRAARGYAIGSHARAATFTMNAPTANVALSAILGEWGRAPVRYRV